MGKIKSLRWYLDEIPTVQIPVDAEHVGYGFYELASIYGLIYRSRLHIPPAGYKYLQKVDYETVWVRY